VTALKLWRLGISALDIALAPCLSDNQRLDLIDAVDKLGNVAHLDNSLTLGNEREVIMIDDNDNVVSEVNTDVAEGSVKEWDKDRERLSGDPTLAKELEDDALAGRPMALQADEEEKGLLDLADEIAETGKDVFKPMFEEDQDKVLENVKENANLGLIPDFMVTIKDQDGNVIARSRVKSQVCCEGDLQMDSVTGSISITGPRTRPDDREAVYKLIDGERDYQDEKWYNMVDDSQWSVNDWLVFIERYLYEARELTGNDGLMMDNIRKIAGLAVAAMEHNKTPSRV
jgi:hypothetical protein